MGAMYWDPIARQYKQKRTGTKRKAAEQEAKALQLAQFAYDRGFEDGRVDALTETKAALMAKFAPAHVYELHEVKAKAGRRFTGLAATWDGPDFHGDKIERGAFARTIEHWMSAKKKLRLLDQHAEDSVLRVLGHARRLEETAAGLLSEFEVVESPTGDELLARVKAGLIDSLSIGYQAKDTRKPTGAERKSGIRRVLTEVALREISVVLHPANPHALIAAG